MDQAVFGGASAPAYSIRSETAQDEVEREALLDRVMGPERRIKSSEVLRCGRVPADGLAFVAVCETGQLIGSIRLWDVCIGPGGPEALLLGPLAVETSLAGRGVGACLMRHALGEARRLGHGAVFLVGDAAYYQRFGFKAAPTRRMAMPGPYEPERFLALALQPGALNGASGTLQASGCKAPSQVLTLDLVA